MYLFTYIYTYSSNWEITDDINPSCIIIPIPSHHTSQLFSSPSSENTYISSLQSITLSVSMIPFRPFLPTVVIQLLSRVWLFATPWTTACQASLSWFPFTVWSPCSPRDSQESSPVPQFESISSSALSLLYGPILTSICGYWKSHSFPLAVLRTLGQMLKSNFGLQWNLRQVQHDRWYHNSKFE